MLTFCLTLKSAVCRQKGHGKSQLLHMPSHQNRDCQISGRSLVPHDCSSTRKRLHMQSKSCMPASLAASVSLRTGLSCFKARFTSAMPMSVYDRSLNLTESSTNSHKHRNQTTGLSKIDVDRKRLVSIFAFAQPLLHRSEPICCDKNWGWVVLHDNLYIAYTALVAMCQRENRRNERR